MVDTSVFYLCTKKPANVVNLTLNPCFNSKTKCEVPCDHIPVRSWPFFRAREVLHGVIESIQREQTT